MENNDLVPDDEQQYDDNIENDIEHDDDTYDEDDRVEAAPSRQDIFEETWNTLMHPFGEACEDHNVEISIAIAKHPDHDEPFVFYRAPHIVDAATLMASVLKGIKSQIFEDLDTNS
jgi:hypothetical protein